MAYAAVVSALLKIRDLFYSFQSSMVLPNLDLEPIYEELCSMESVLKRYTSTKDKKLRLDPLEEQIEDAVETLEDLIDSHISSHQFLSNSEGCPKEYKINYSIILTQKLLKLKEEVNSLTKKLKTKLELYMEEDRQRSNSFAAEGEVSSRIYDSGERKNSNLVGLDEELRLLMDWVLGSSKGLETTTIIGMAGIGKTTLVQEVYDHPSILRHFDTRVMVTIGPKFKLREFLLLVLNCIGTNDIVEGHEKLEIYQLEVNLWKFLKGRRYLIVLDDVWDVKVWKELQLFFPKNLNRSRIILTTRLLDVAPPRSGTVHLHKKYFLSDDDSWKLLRETAFPNSKECCSFEIEKIGRKIATNCEGLPLAIVLVGKLLFKAEKTVEHWKKVSEDEDPLNIGNDDTTSISKSLHLSYEMLPRHLKVCFLYVGVFPKSYEISTSGLIRLWIAEGFLTPQEGIRIEVVGEAWLDELVSKSVVLVRESGSRPGKIKTCRIHFVFRNLCIGEARKEQFCHVINKYAYSFPQSTNRQRRLCIHNNVVLGIKEVYTTTKALSALRSLLCFGPHHPYPLWVHFSFQLLRVLDALRIRFYEFPYQVLKLVRLRYLALTYDGEVPTSISKLKKLRVMIMSRYQSIKSPNAPTNLPMEMWSLKWLRHLKCTGFDLPDPEFFDYHTLDHFLSLSGVSAHSCSKGVLEKLPNLKKLGVRIELAHDEVESFSFFGNAQHLHHLLSFKCIVLGLNYWVVPPKPCFPPTLTKLTLSGCGFLWEHMTAIGSLQYLEVLKLQCYAFRGPMWEPSMKEFPRLKFLLLEDLDLEEWRAKVGHFPKLARLVIKHCYRLRKISLEVGDIPSLKLIEVEDCCSSLAALAKQIQEKKEKKKSLGNESLQVCIHFSWNERKKSS